MALIDSECPASLEEVLLSPSGLFYFTEYLDKEHSRENIEFYYEINHYKVLGDEPELRIEEAQRLFSTYIEEKSPLQINIDSKERMRIEMAVFSEGGCGIEIFDAAQSEIFKLMSKDSFQRFLHSKEFGLFKAARFGSKRSLSKDDRKKSSSTLKPG